MSDYCNKNPLHRDGTSQGQRILNALLPGYVAVDERSMDDLAAFIVDYAREIVFYNQNNDPDGDWEAFFKRKIDTGSQYNAPHFALFMAFLKLFSYAQDEMNKITRKHLDYYYRDVLRLTENPAVPDQVYLVFELAKHASSHLIKKNTAFKAGKDALGKNVIYRNNEEISLNKAAVTELKAVFTNKHHIFSDLEPAPANDYRIYVSKQANSEDGNGKKLENEEKSWRTFGGVTCSITNPDADNVRSADRIEAEIGFAFASPNLFMAEGERVVTLYLNLSKDSNDLDTMNDALVADAFRVQFSGEKEWIEPVDEAPLRSFDMVDPKVSKRVLDFVNSATSAAGIAGAEPVNGPVFDDPELGFSGQRAGYDIGVKAASRILAERNRLGSGGFTSLDQLFAIDYIGIDKMRDLVFSFGDNRQSTTIDKENHRIIIKRTIGREQPAIVAYNEKTLLDPFRTSWPVVKVLLNTRSESNPFIYKYLRRLKLESAEIAVDVRGVKNLVIQNDQSVLDPGKPFQPFGNRPVVGSNFYIGSWEVFQKSLNALSINIRWFDLPKDPNGFRDHYMAYIPDPNKRRNNLFYADLALLDRKRWVPMTPESGQLFDSQDYEALKADNTFSIVAGDYQGTGLPHGTIGNVAKDERLEPFGKYTQSTQKGFVRMTLAGIDFGHKDYQLSYTKAVLAGINVQVSEPVADYSNGLPKEPYTPQIEGLSIDYVATERLDTVMVLAEAPGEIPGSAYHVGAFGVVKLDVSKSENYLLAQYDNEGELYIGIKDIDPPRNLLILFQMAEGSSNPDLMPPKIRWSYLSHSEWIDFPVQNILSDSTKGLITTGLVLFDIPSEATNDQTILTNGLYWIRASAEADSGGIPKMIDIRCQAAKVTFQDYGNDPAYLSKPMPGKTISKPVYADAAIKKIDQPYTSFGGRVKEERNDFYTRVSERLRHKHRAVTLWDHERIILQHFPSVYKVKCLNHTRYEGTLESINEASPGHVSLIVVSNLRNRNAVDSLKPRTSLVTLSAISELVSQLHAPAVHLHVQNPLFEEVKIVCNVMFRKGLDKGMYATILERALIEFLSPWAYESGSDMVFGGKIYKSVILNFVEELEYVDYITCFKMLHSVPGDPGNDPERDVNEAEASTSASILVSAVSHGITALENDGECRCPDNETEILESAR
jgi:hypothetical protein